MTMIKLNPDEDHTDFFGQYIQSGDKVVYYYNDETFVGVVLRYSLFKATVAIQAIGTNDFINKPVYCTTNKIIKLTEDMEKLLTMKLLKQ